MIWLWLLLGVFGRPALAEDPPDVPQKCLGFETRQVRCLAVPKLSFDTDDGAGTGARLELQWADDGDAGFRRRVMLDSYVTLRGWHLHQFRWEELGVGPRERGRISLFVAYRQRLNDDYYGLGSGAVRDRALLGDFDDDDPRATAYRFRIFQPFIHLVWRQEVHPSGLEVFAGFHPRLTLVRPFDGSVLDADQPYGIAGGLALQGFVGLLHDTRQPELVPRRGHLVELSGRVTPQLPGDVGGEAGGFGGGLVSARGYAPLGDRVVLAGRIMGEWLVGDVPFYEMVWWGGALPVRGMGGFETVRGLTLNRLYGPAKALANLEGRWRAFDTRILGRMVGWELAPFVDVGAVWGAGDVIDGAPLFPGFGVGGRLVFQESFVARGDLGFGFDPVRELDGTVVRELTPGLYLFLDYPF